MKYATSFATVALAALAAASIAHARPDTAPGIKPLHIGDPAPALDLTHWVKGQPVKAFEPGNVYVVEFWATWCGPCRMSMPHITELQKKYEDYKVTFIGISDEDLKTVKGFMDSTDKKDNVKWTDKMGYTIAADADQSAYEKYMYGVGAGGIPTAFIVGKDGKVEWSGHPMKIDDAIAAVVKDTWDRKAFATEFEPKAEKAREQMKPMLEARAKTRPYQLALINAKEKGDWDAASEAYDALIENSKRPATYKVEKFEMLLRDANMPDKAYAYGDEIAKENWDQPMPLNQLAWFVVDEPGIKTRNFDFAMKLAQRANELTDEKDGAILDTLARVYAEKGDYTNAVKYQQMAVDNAPEQMKVELEAALKEYKAKAGK